jgi:hypothetical protein
MRIFTLIALLCACNPDDSDTTSDTETADSDSGQATGCDVHPLIPEEFCYIWVVNEPCKRRGGANGRRAYRLMEDGRVVDGRFTATERWFFFWGDPARFDEDVVDTLSYDGTTSTQYTGAELNCEGCEEVYEVKRTIVDAPSGTPYATDVVFALDNLNPNGGYQGGDEERNMFVFYARYGRNGLGDLDTSYARGQYTPDSGSPGTFPASYSWKPFDVQGRCY